MVRRTGLGTTRARVGLGTVRPTNPGPTGGETEGNRLYLRRVGAPGTRVVVTVREPTFHREQVTGQCLISCLDDTWTSRRSRRTCPGCQGRKGLDGPNRLLADTGPVASGTDGDPERQGVGRRVGPTGEEWCRTHTGTEETQKVSRDTWRESVPCRSPGSVSSIRASKHRTRTSSSR